MIRIFNLFCKLNEIKISDQQWFDQALRSLCLPDRPCPRCGSKGNLIPHDSYSRYIVTLSVGKAAVAILHVPRVKCTSCGHTHGLLPEMLIPYSSYSLRFVLTVLKDYFLRVRFSSPVKFHPASSFFQFSGDIRRIMYTTNIIEGLNRQYRKVTKKWTQRYRNWDQVLNQLIILYDERLTAYL